MTSSQVTEIIWKEELSSKMNTDMVNIEQTLQSFSQHTFPVMAVFIGGLKWFVYTSGLSGESYKKKTHTHTQQH